MKKAEGSDLPLELERRLKVGVDQLRKMTDSLEGLVRVADALGPALGVKRRPGRPRGGSRPATSAAGGQFQATRGTAAPPPGKQSQTAAPPAAAQEEEIPEWRKLFPGLAKEVPHRKNKSGS